MGVIIGSVISVLGIILIFASVCIVLPIYIKARKHRKRVTPSKTLDSHQSCSGMKIKPQPISPIGKRKVEHKAISADESAGRAKAAETETHQSHSGMKTTVSQPQPISKGKVKHEAIPADESDVIITGRVEAIESEVQMSRELPYMTPSVAAALLGGKYAQQKLVTN